MILPDADWVIAACAADDNGGWCVECGEEAYGVEPDARGHECEACGKRGVYGAEELLVSGYYEGDGE